MVFSGIGDPILVSNQGVHVLRHDSKDAKYIPAGESVIRCVLIVSPKIPQRDNSFGYRSAAKDEKAAYVLVDSCNTDKTSCVYKMIDMAKTDEDSAKGVAETTVFKSQKEVIPVDFISGPSANYFTAWYYKV